MIDGFKNSIHEFNNEIFGYDINTGKVNLDKSKIKGLSVEEIKGLGEEIGEVLRSTTNLNEAFFDIGFTDWAIINRPEQVEFLKAF